MPTSATAETVLVHAAGSLRGALTEVAKAFEAASGATVQMKYGPSGILKDAIANGEKAEVFASANMEHPQALAAAKKSGPVVLFARNQLCALVRPGLNVTSAQVLDRMLDPQVKLATSTPKADPSGDYAFEVFRKAEALKPGARRRSKRRRCNSLAVRTAQRRPPVQVSMPGISPRGGPTSISPTAPRRAKRSSSNLVSRSSPCRRHWRSAPIME
jgi:ABC-type molybdate transport system substrate-binding protein